MNSSHFPIRISRAAMTTRRSTRLSERKQPQQARSAELVAAILQAGAQVLAKEGAARFTTARVAEKAGVSIGSLYQYFPNKAAILYRLQTQEWQQTSDLLRRLLEDARHAPPQRLRNLVHAFVRSECEEAVMRVALNDAAPLYRDAPEARATKEEGGRIVLAFLEEALPNASDATRVLAGDLITHTLSAVGKQFSESPRTDAEIEAYADALADMLCAYLDSLARGVGQARRQARK
ncbi:Transcriptional regulator, TetR family [Achromobacter xylosoxidans NBRC 15126 = ATCC 27061]|jgi:AcrR family transcriptional regulator|nr:Transcriptional regulator, TetR family [Achromobacter xylosoxidans NBRC 15126 = ATCC 27061]EFV85404.1 TetR family Transcriptional regulator [Achromobacter xylosoxidans C54]